MQADLDGLGSILSNSGAKVFRFPNSIFSQLHRWRPCDLYSYLRSNTIFFHWPQIKWWWVSDLATLVVSLGFSGLRGATFDYIICGILLIRSRPDNSSGSLVCEKIPDASLFLQTDNVPSTEEGRGGKERRVWGRKRRKTINWVLASKLLSKLDLTAGTFLLLTWY